MRFVNKHKKIYAFATPCFIGIAAFVLSLASNPTSGANGRPLLRVRGAPIQDTASVQTTGSKDDYSQAAVHATQAATMPATTTQTKAAITQGKGPFAASSIGSLQSHESQLFADPTSYSEQSALADARAQPNDAAAFNRLATTPMANWFTGNETDIRASVSQLVSTARAVNQLPVLVAYNIPQRDCGSFSSGGAASEAAYNNWIQNFTAGIGNNPAIVILEPDALAGLDCLSSGDQASRLAMLKQAVDSLTSESDASVYIDAGNPSWQPVNIMASRLNKVDVGKAAGFSLNVSNFIATSTNVAYGSALASLIPGSHFVIDTSRNRNGAMSDNEWCNPAGRAFGNTPSLSTGNNLVDAYLWIKNPGESDGSCGPAINGSYPPPAGTWWSAYVTSLIINSGW